MSIAAVLLVEIIGFSMLPIGATAVMESGAYVTSATSAGEVTLSWDPTGTSQTTVSLASLTPGSSMQRIANLHNSGSVSLSALQLALVGTATGTMSDGVTVALDRCSVPWAPAGAEYTCSATTTPVSVDRPLPGVVTLVGSPAAVPNSVDHLRLTIGLAESSPSAAQTQTATLTLTASGVQRDAMQR